MREGERQRGREEKIFNPSKSGKRYSWSDETVVCPASFNLHLFHKVIRIFLGHFTVMTVNTLKVLILC